MPDRVESLGEVDSSWNRSIAQPEYVKPIRNGLEKEGSMIQSRLSWGGNRLGREREQN